MAETKKKSSDLNISAQQIARVYAEAFLDAAQSAGKIDVLAEEFDSFITEVLDRHPELERVLGSLLISHEEKTGILDRVLAGQASSELLVFLKVVSQHDRLDCLRSIRHEVHMLYNQRQGKVDVSVRTASPLTDETQQVIVDRLSKMLGSEPILEAITDPSMLGGVVVRVGDTVLDGSLSTQLRHLRSHIIERNVEQIQSNRDRFV